MLLFSSKIALIFVPYSALVNKPTSFKYSFKRFFVSDSFNGYTGLEIAFTSKAIPEFIK